MKYSKGEQYCRSIKNYQKRQYAYNYRDFIRGYTKEKPQPPKTLSLMAAQAVRLNLDECLLIGSI